MGQTVNRTGTLRERLAAADPRREPLPRDPSDPTDEGPRVSPWVRLALGGQQYPKRLA